MQFTIYIKTKKSEFHINQLKFFNKNYLILMEQVNTTHDLYDNKVVVIQEEDLQQFVFSYRCANLKGLI